MTPFDKFLLMLSLFFDLSVFPGFLYAYVELLCFVLSSYCFYTNGGVFYALFCILMFSLIMFLRDMSMSVSREFLFKK